RSPMRSTFALFALLAIAGCNTVKQDSGACPVPPPVPAEAVPKAPVSENMQYWQPSYVDWDGANYHLVPGRWVARTGGSGLWMPGFWDRPTVPGPCVWVPAHWM